MANAEAWITGVYPNQKLNLKLPSGPTGDAGPSNSLTIGTVTTTEGSTASATITGTSPNQVLNLSIPRGTAAAIAYAIAL